MDRDVTTANAYYNPLYGDIWVFVSNVRKENMTKRGPKPHQDRPTTIKLRLPSSLLDRLRQWAQTHNTTVSDVLRDGAKEKMKGDRL